MSNQWRIQAMEDYGVKIAVINLVKRFVVFENGCKFKICCLYDEDYEETADLEEVRYFEFGDKKLGYGNGYISEQANKGNILH